MVYKGQLTPSAVSLKVYPVEDHMSPTPVPIVWS